jgi:methyl-accepting chemotaxis protein
MVISLSLLSFLIYRDASDAVEHRVEKETQNIATQISQQISRSVETDAHILLSLSKMVQTATNLDDALADQHTVLTEFGHIFMTDTDGLLLNLSPFDRSVVGTDLSQTDYVSHMKKEQKPFISKPQKGFFDYEALVMAVPVFFDVGSGKYKFFGIMCGTLKLDTFFKPFRELNLERSGYVMVLDDHGHILSHPDPNVIMQKKISEMEGDNPSLTALWNAIAGKKGGVHLYTYQEQTHIAGFASIIFNDWSVVVTVPIKEVLTDVEKLKTGALILTLFFLGLTILFVFFAARSISRPLVIVTQEVEAFVGSTIQDIKTQKRDEVSILVDSIKALMDYLREMASVASSIAQGDLSLQTEPKSRQDVLGQAFTQMTQYFREMAEAANKLAEGDLTQTVQPKSEKDVLGRAFQNMITRLRSTVSQIRSNADQNAQASAQISKRSEEDLKAAENISSSAEETSSAMTQMRASVEEVAESTETLFSATQQISSSIQEMVSSIQQVTHNSGKLSELAQMTAVAMNQMVQSVERIAKNAADSKRFYQETSEVAERGQVSVQQVIASMDKIRQVVSSATQTIQNLEGKSQEIGSILNVIDDIADQTALLALNASILAAQAGEHGRGFSVVAEEIKGLAGRVAGSTQEIAQIIREVQKQSVDAVRVIQEGNKQVDEGVQLVHRAGQALEHITASARNSLSAASEIARAIQEQKESTQKVMKSVENVTEQISEINRATLEQERGSSQILNAVEEVRGLTEHVKRATMEQTKSTKQVGIAMEEVKSLILQNTTNARHSTQAAEALSSQAKGLRQLVGQFTLSTN